MARLKTPTRRVGLVAALAVTLLMGAAIGFVVGNRRTSPEQAAPTQLVRTPAQEPTSYALAERRAVPVWHRAAGTVQSRNRATLAAQISG